MHMLLSLILLTFLPPFFMFTEVCLTTFIYSLDTSLQKVEGMMKSSGVCD